MGSVEKVMGLFVNRDSVRFSDIEKALELPSIKTAHVVNEILKKGWIGRNGSEFTLSKTGQQIVPKIHDTELHKKNFAEFAILLLVKHKNEWLLTKKQKPFANYWGIISTEPLVKESILDAAARTLRNQTGYEGNFVAFRGFVHQRFQKSDSDAAYGILVLELSVENYDAVKPSPDTKWFDIAEMEKIRMIPSDKWIIRKFFNSSLVVYESTMGENQGLLTDFRVDEIS